MKEVKIYELNSSDAHDFFLKEENYCTIKLPVYFSFQKIINEADKALKGIDFKTLFQKNGPKQFDNVNCNICINKGGNFQWRVLSIINPYLYVNAVNQITTEKNWRLITNRIAQLQSESKHIVSCAWPLSTNVSHSKGTAIKNWWLNFEQECINLSASYEYMGITDISNCYSSIYTHTISWAIHGRNKAKEKRHENELIGNCIDEYLMEVHCGQTNGIPEGSALSDFIAEIILSYADSLLSKQIPSDIVDFKILRYRDDYRIFSNNQTDIKTIMKLLSDVLSQLSLKINSDKTKISSNILEDAIKADKKYLMNHTINRKNLQTHLYSIWNLANLFPGCGSVTKELEYVYERKIFSLKKMPKNVDQLIALTIGIMKLSSNYYPYCISILSKLSSFKNMASVIDAILDKAFKDSPNTDYLNIWIQRMSLKNNRGRTFNTKLCNSVSKGDKIWGWEWIEKPPQESIIDEKELEGINSIVSAQEISVFDNHNFYN